MWSEEPSHQLIILFDVFRNSTVKSLVLSDLHWLPVRQSK